jgi:hypothetical protein
MCRHFQCHQIKSFFILYFIVPSDLSLSILSVADQKVRMTIYILLLLSVYAAAFETTICNCKDPILQEHLRIDDDQCQPICRPTQRNADYAVWTNRKEGLKVHGYVCSRWEKINHISTNLFLQQIVVPDKRAVDTTEAECKIMAQTKRCEEILMKFADGKWLYVPEPSENGA